MENHYSRAVIGGGLFGCFAALALAQRGHRVVLIEKSSGLLTRASLVNQARLHTGLHYPRSIITAGESLRAYQSFRHLFPEAVIDFDQIYAVAAHGSKVSAAEFGRFVERLGVHYVRVDPDRWFQPGSVAGAWKVEEPTFDAVVMRRVLAERIASHPRVDLMSRCNVVGARSLLRGVELVLTDGLRLHVDGVVLCAYADTNALRTSLGLPPLPLTYELAEVITGEVSSRLQGMGLTVMDGPFFSVMPFGQSGRASLTSVGNTPRARTSTIYPVFECQDSNPRCSPFTLAECDTCGSAPSSGVEHHLQVMRRFLRDDLRFYPRQRHLTVKAVLASTEVDDARPTIVRRDGDRVWTVLSGKVSTIVDLEEALI